MYNDGWDDWYDEREDAREDWQDHREDLVDERGDRREDLADERGDRAQTTQQQRTERQQTRQENRPESQAQREQRRTEAQVGGASAGRAAPVRKLAGYSRDTAQDDPGTERHRLGRLLRLFEREVGTRGQLARSTQPEQLGRTDGADEIEAGRAMNVAQLALMACGAVCASCRAIAPLHLAIERSRRRRTRCAR